MEERAVGTSQVQPSRRDRRFADPGWAGNPLLNPAAPKAAIDTGGGSVLAGLQHRERADRAQGPAPARVR